jgi:iron complex outermembrane recepter protein
VWSYEVGGKTRMLDGRLQLDASVYLIDWTDIQQLYNLPLCGFQFTTNAGSATSKGFELQLQARPVDPLLVGLAVGYNISENDETVFAAAGAGAPPPGTKALMTKGDRIPVNPWTVSFTSQWDFLAYTRDAYFRLNYDYQAGLEDHLPHHNANNGSYDPTIPGLAEVNELGLKLGVKVGAADIAVFVDNATDEHPGLSRDHSGVRSPLYTNITLRPRTVGVTMSYRY